METGDTPVLTQTSRSLRGSSSTKNNAKKQHKANKKLEVSQDQDRENDKSICHDCNQEVKNNDRGIECDICKGWYHKERQKVSDALYQVLISEEQRQISWYCSSCQRGAKAIMTQLLVMHERQNQFDHKLSVLENKHDTLNNRVSEVEDAVAKVADLQAQAANKSLATNQIPPILNKEEVVATVYTQVNDRINRRKNIVVYNVQEGTSTLKAENATHDRELMKQLTEPTTGGQYQPESLQVRRLRSRANNETGTDEARSRPLLVTFPGEDKKASVMKNLHKLKNKGEPFSEMVITHDMSREDREKERLLQKEAREKTQQEQTSNVVYIVRGRPGERQVIKVKKRSEMNNPTQAQV